MPIVATPGASDANCYVTESEANAYFLNRAHSSNWETTGDVESLLITASQMLDWYMDWSGAKASTTQAMEWPRSGVYDRDDNLIDDAIIPNRIKQATYELAFSLIAGDRVADNDMDGFAEMKVGPLSLKSDGALPRTTRRQAIPKHIQQMLSDYVDTPFGSSRLIRG